MRRINTFKHPIIILTKKICDESRTEPIYHHFFCFFCTFVKTPADQRLLYVSIAEPNNTTVSVWENRLLEKTRVIKFRVKDGLIVSKAIFYLLQLFSEITVALCHVDIFLQADDNPCQSLLSEAVIAIALWCKYQFTLEPLKWSFSIYFQFSHKEKCFPSSPASCSEI